MVRVAVVIRTLAGVWALGHSSMLSHFDPSKFRVRC